MTIMVSYLPTPKKVGEMKTKPTQNAIRTLNSAGIQADIILGRAEWPLDAPRKRKLSVFCNVDLRDIISAPDVDTIYEIPLLFKKENLGKRILLKFGLKNNKKDLTEWKKMVNKSKRLKKEVKIGIVGKYFSTGKFVLSDSYISVIEAVKHACWANNYQPKLLWLNSEEYEADPKKLRELKELDGVIIPGGFGTRGVEGKIKAVEFARKNKIPYLGLCYGMHMVVIEFARHICKLRNANTAEINSSTKNPVIHIMPDQEEKVKDKRYGGTMRLGAYPCVLSSGSISKGAYGKRNISERHRHRYEFNNDYRDLFQKKGLVIAGVSPDRKLVEIVELPKSEHPFFVGVQFHPEFKSRPLSPHPLFKEFIKAAIKRKK